MRGPLFSVRMRRRPKSPVPWADECWYRGVESTGKCEGQLEKKQWRPCFVWTWTIAQASWCWCLFSAVSSLFIFVVGYIGWSSSESRSITEQESITLYCHTQLPKQLQCPQHGCIVCVNKSVLVLPTMHLVSFVQFTAHKLQNLKRL